MTIIALLLGILSFIGSILFFLGELTSPAEWGVLVFGLGGPGLGLVQRRTDGVDAPSRWHRDVPK